MAISRDLLEGFQDEGDVPVQGTILSTEDQLLVAESGQEALNEATHLLDEVDRLSDVSDGLEELVALTEGLEAATSRDLGFVQNSLQLALAGTDLGVEELLPSLESYEGTTISTESLKKTAQRIWQSIVKAVKRIWEAIKGFFVGAKGDATRLNLMVTQVRHKAENLSGASISNVETALGREINVLSTFHRPPRNAKDIIDGLSEFKRQTGFIFGAYTDEIIKLGKDLTKVISSFDPEKCDKSLEKMTDVVESFDTKRLMGSGLPLKEVVDGRWDKGTAFRPPALMGNKSIFFTFPKARGDGTSTRARAEAARNRRALIAMASPEPIHAIPGGNVKTFPARSVVEITHLINDLTKAVSDYQSKAKELERIQENMQKGSRHLASLLEREGLDPDQRSCIKSALRFNVAYSHWATQPQASLVSLTMSAARASLSASKKSLKNH